MTKKKLSKRQSQLLSDADCQQMVRDTIADGKMPDWPTLRLLAARMLDQNPKLAAAMEAENLDDARQAIRGDFRIPALASARKRLDQASTDAITRVFSEAGFNGTLYSMASQFHHPDWFDRGKNAAEPTGLVRQFWHFTSIVHLPVILEFGIERGDVCIEPGDEMRNYNAPWLTTDPSFDRQGWAEGEGGKPNSTFDKRAVRLEVSIPENDPALSTWAEVCKRENVPEYWATSLNSCGGDEHWFVYNARIPRSWITAIAYREPVSLETGRYGIARVRDLSS